MGRPDGKKKGKHWTYTGWKKMTKRQIALRKPDKVKPRVRENLGHWPGLQKKWDNKLSVRGNFKNMVLKDVQEKLGHDNAQPFPLRLEPEDIKVIRNLEKKHGADFQRMANDIKINVWQWTSKECQRRLQRADKFVAQQAALSAAKEVRDVVRKAREEEEAAKWKDAEVMSNEGDSEDDDDDE